MSLLTIGIIIYSVVSFFCWTRLTSYLAYDARHPESGEWLLCGIISFILVGLWPITLLAYAISKHTAKIKKAISTIFTPMKPIVRFLFKKPKYKTSERDSFEYHPQLDD